MSAVGGFFLKVGAIQVQYDDGIVHVFRQVLFNYGIAIGVLMYFIPVLIWIFLLKKIELSFLQPMFALVYVITPIMASIFLKENVTIARWIGIGVIIIGVIIVARN